MNEKILDAIVVLWTETTIRRLADAIDYDADELEAMIAKHVAKKRKAKKR